MIRSFTILVLAVLWVAPVQGQNSKKLQRITKKPSTFYIAEVSAGGAFGTGFAERSMGYALRTTLGVGGSFGSYAPRFYAIGVARKGSLGAQVTKGTQVSEITRELLDFSAGLRVLVPYDRFRALFEFTMGRSFVVSTALINARERYNADEKRFTFYTALGGQYRFNLNFSMGVLVEWSLPTSREFKDLILEVSRVEDNDELHGWTTVTATAQFHF
ncbi:MAG TPA: hypothetical protein EYN06_00970 [Myxococcales bacterium]|nr:hypothetical protein [Myxococcales bacterium]HIN85021.1 hypothetical protein [Myxococcales bacterium]